MRVSNRTLTWVEDVKGLLAELNGDTLWSLVVKQRQDHDRKSRPNEKRQGKSDLPEIGRDSSVWDVRRLIKFTNDQLAFLKSQETPREADEVRYRDSNDLVELRHSSEHWDVLYNSQPDLDQSNIRNVADDGGLFQRSLENIVDQNLIQTLLFREENSGVSQGGHSFRLLSSAYSFGTQTPRAEDPAEALKQNKAAKSFKTYILGQDA